SLLFEICKMCYYAIFSLLYARSTLLMILIRMTITKVFFQADVNGGPSIKREKKRPAAIEEPLP
ncbi:hypothetical protein, partial [Enterocloster citroniae]|uniref:hypothetical protein n=1 Tax=Enterocloster citroniae TaxID=358743 RepID=UPI001D146C65